MKTITQDFQNALKGIKQIDVVISYADRENTNFIITQNSELLQTEAQDFLVTESAEVIIDNNGIQGCNVYWNTDILKSCCKMLDLETSNSIPKGTELFVRIGLLIDGEYEYVDYGSFFTTEESEKKLDTGTYLTTAYDKMVRFSINASENPLTFETGVTYTLKQYLEMICNKCGVFYSLSGLSSNTNANISLINSDLYSSNKDVTYRDIIDDIAECLGTNFLINNNGYFVNKDLNTTSVMTIDEQNLKDTNVNIGEKKAAIDGVQVYDGSAILNYVGDDNSIYKIKNNNIMNTFNSQLLSYVLTKIGGFSYYTFDIETFGVLALDPFDCFTTSANNTNYLLCSLHNEISANQGLGEQISYEFKDEDGTYKYAVPSDSDKLRNAYIELNKAAGEIDIIAEAVREANSKIVLKANSSGNIVTATLEADPSTGSSFNVKADNVNFNGKNFNLTSDNMSISSTNFNVDSSGNVTANNGTFTGTINASGGTVGRYEITSTYLQTGTGSSQAGMGGTAALWAGSESSMDAPFHVTYGGALTSKSGSVGGWTIGRNYLENSGGGYTVRFNPQYLSAKAPGDTWEDLRWYTLVDQVSDNKTKHNIKYLDSEYDEFYDNLKPVSFVYNDEYEPRPDYKGKTHFGFIAQDIKDNIKKTKSDDLSMIYGNKLLKLEKQEIIALNTLQIQKLKKEVQELKKEVQELKKEIKTLKGDDN